MWFFRKKKGKDDSFIIRQGEINKEPPAPPITDDAVDIVWNKDRTKFFEVIYNKNAGAYMYRGSQLEFCEYHYGWFWNGIYSISASYFDSVERAKIAAKEEFRLMGDVQ